MAPGSNFQPKGTCSPALGGLPSQVMPHKIVTFPGSDDSRLFSDCVVSAPGGERVS